MIVKLYPGSDTDLKLRLLDSIKQIDTNASIDTDNAGYHILTDTSMITTEEIAENISVLIFEFYLEEAILLKMYDEYALTDSRKASLILKQICDMFTESTIADKVGYYIENGGQINIESFVMFNIRNIMLTAYRLSDICYSKFVYSSESLAVTDLISSYQIFDIADIECAADNMIQDDKRR